MARKRDIITRFLGDEKDLLRATRKVQQETGGLAKGFASVKTAAQGMIGLAVVRVFAGWARAAVEDADSQAILAHVLTSTTKATRTQIGAVEDWISATQRQTGVADTELRPALANLLTFGMSLADAQKNLAIAMDIATAKGLNLESVVTAIGKASNGQVGALGRLGIAVRDDTGAIVSFDEAMARAAETMGGALAASAATTAGQIRLAKDQFGELTETIGASLLKPIGEASAGLLALSDVLSGTSARAAHMRETLTILGIEGIDVMANKTAAALTAIKRAGIGIDDLDSQLDLLAGDLQLSAADWDNLADAVASGRVDIGLSKTELAALNDELANRADLAQYTEATRGLTDALTASSAATDRRINSQLGLNDVLLASLSPTFAVLSATNAARDAADKYQEVVAESGPNSEEAERAALALAEALARLATASDKFSLDGGPQGIRTLEEMLATAGVARETIQRLTDAITGLNRSPIVARLPGTGRRLDKFHDGGVVAGPVGREQLAIVKGGETILPTHRPGFRGASSGGGMGPVTINVAAADPEQTARTVARHLRRLNREVI